MPRYFFALWPDDETSSRLRDITESLQPDTGRIVPSQNLHITLAFLGTRAPEVVERLREGAALIKRPGFSLSLRQLGWWNKPKVMWIAPEVAPVPLLKLVSDINILISEHGIKPDWRPYQPHMTLARKVSHRPGAIEITPIPWEIDSFCLVRSNTLPAGAVYEVIETWTLSSV